MGWYIGQAFPVVLYGYTVNIGPEIGAQRTKLFLDVDNAPGILYGRSYLELIANNAGIAQKTSDISLGIAGDALTIEIVKSFSVVSTLVQDGQPAQSGLCALEHKKLE